ncbi:TRAP transporter substrate-binding protein DctP [Chelativorans sp. Marseille-P2723]|uniref:TRAP transporter substrate-binding protein n=1 Tax=Chelativorans sp. Marseille-P2723 TaxID=2709133 RepID=UPI001570230F|nr:TRAP transporter substrate-binding protein DctP [Chelativorans sp. Marseille-P2723]
MAAAQETITLRVADHYPPSSATPKYTIQYFMDYVKDKAGDRVEFEYYPAEQLGKAKDMLSLTQQGAVDISLVVPAYVSDKMPLSAVAELPGTYATSCQGAEAYWNMVKEGILAEQEFEKNGIKPLLAFMLPPYQILTREPINTIDDLSGLKLRSGGTAQDITIKALGAVPVRMGGVEVNEALTRGTLDGAVFPLQAAIDFRLTETLKATTIGQNFGGFAATYSISNEKWDALPDDLKALFHEASEAAVRDACQRLDADNSGPALERMAEQSVKASKLPEDVAAEVATRLADVHRSWADSLNQRGLPGSELLDAFLAELDN